MALSVKIYLLLELIGAVSTQTLMMPAQRQMELAGVLKLADVARYRQMYLLALLTQMDNQEK
jgi:hypothetical protein